MPRGHHVGEHVSQCGTVVLPEFRDQRHGLHAGERAQSRPAHPVARSLFCCINSIRYVYLSVKGMVEKIFYDAYIPFL